MGLPSSGAFQGGLYYLGPSYISARLLLLSRLLLLILKWSFKALRAESECGITRNIIKHRQWRLSMIRNHVRTSQAYPLDLATKRKILSLLSSQASPAVDDPWAKIKPTPPTSLRRFVAHLTLILPHHLSFF